jgi:DNA invertase Pin-like site-specific DNA recombinase
LLTSKLILDKATNTATSLLLSQLERSLIQERTKAGREAAKRRAVKPSRKPKLSPQRVTHARKLIEDGESPAQVAQLLKVARSTLYAAL